MIESYWLLLVFQLIGSIYGLQPNFAEPLKNVSVPVGREATFSCVVNHLGGYRDNNSKQKLQVGWVKADTKAIQAIHNHVITHNSRVSVSHTDRNTWMLHIKSVQEEDRGPYMCQINTDPMRSQIGFLEVTVPPRIVDEESSHDVFVPEGSTAVLMCRAKGHPKPKVIWTREDHKPIMIRNNNDQDKPRVKTSVYEGEILNLTHITRSDMGPYLCIANNSIPPIVSKRINVEVHFTPVVHVPNQLLGVPLGSSVTLECNVEASPKSIQYWTKNYGTMLISNDQYDISEEVTNYYVTQMRLKMNYFSHDDAGTYYCTAKNSLGDVQGKIKVYTIEVSTAPPTDFDTEGQFETSPGRSPTDNQHPNEISRIPWGNTYPPYPPYRGEDRGANGHKHGHSNTPEYKNYPHNNDPSLTPGGKRPTRPPLWSLPSSANNIKVEYSCCALIFKLLYSIWKR